MAMLQSARSQSSPTHQLSRHIMYKTALLAAFTCQDPQVGGTRELLTHSIDHFLAPAVEAADLAAAVPVAMAGTSVLRATAEEADKLVGHARCRVVAVL